jgi:hypothetical protein
MPSNDFILHRLFYVILVISLAVVMVSSISTAASAAGSPCDLFTPEDLAKLTEDQKKKVKEAIQECEREIQKGQIVERPSASSEQVPSQSFRYKDALGEVKVYHGEEMRGAFPERGSRAAK